jgi:arylsulfatase A-like enzyme
LALCFLKRAGDFIRDQKDSDDPFFMFVTPNGPYGQWPAIKGPCVERHRDRYENMEINSVPREGICQATIDQYSLIKSDVEKGGPDRGSLLRLPNDVNALRNYFSQVSVVDDLVGTIVSATEEAGVADNTLIIYTSDHGFSLGHHGFWGHAIETWPSNAHRCAYNVPLLVKWPGKVKEGHTSDHLIGGPDLYASVLEAAGIVENEAPSPVSSRSIIPLLNDDNADWEDVVFIDQEETRAIRTPEWLFVKRVKTPDFPELVDELYHLKSDPDERENVIGDPANADVITELSGRLDEFFSAAADGEFDLWSGGDG